MADSAIVRAAVLGYLDLDEEELAVVDVLDRHGEREGGGGGVKLERGEGN